MTAIVTPSPILVSTMNDVPGYQVVAVLAMRFDTGVFASVMNEVAAYGTAVSIRPINQA